jgi:hypothetical protein
MIPVQSTPILEEIQQLAAEDMNIDTPVATQEPQNQEEETLKEMQPENTKVAPKVNGMAPKPTTAVEPDESQTAISEHLIGDMVKDVSVWTEWVTEAQPEATGSSH